MKVITVKNYQELSEEASKIVGDLIKHNPSATLGLATGSSPVGLYKNLIKLYQNNEITFKNVKTYNLDEYCDLPKEHEQSYYTFMHVNLFDHIDINEDNINIPSSIGENLNELCANYNQKLTNAAIDLQILGIGTNGHIGFNEPNTSFDQETFIVKLTEKTRLDNMRFFNTLEEVPTHAITMGIKNIMGAQKIILLASGKSKAEAIKRLIEGEVNEVFPASILKTHKDVMVIVDEEAASLLLTKSLHKNT